MLQEIPEASKIKEVRDRCYSFLKAANLKTIKAVVWVRKLWNTQLLFLDIDDDAKFMDGRKVEADAIGVPPVF